MNIYLGAAGAVCPLGNSLTNIFSEMQQGHSGIQPVKNAFGLDKDEFLGIIPDKLLPRTEESKLRNMLVACMSQTLDGMKNPALLKAADTRVILCTTKGEIDRLEHETAESANLYHLSRFLKHKYDLAHDVTIISSACISGLLGIINGARMIRAGVCSRVLVAGADLVSRFTLSGFISFFATGSSVCKPYDEHRDGINLGEAAASVLLSSDQEIFRRPLGKYSGGASANDANHISGPSRTGEGLYRSVQHAFQDDGIKPGQIDYISAHGTATRFNDEMEAIAFNRLELSNVPLNSLKGYLGHTLGAAGLIETLVGLESLRQQTLLSSFGFESPGVSQPLQVLSKNLQGDFSTMLKTASGFGGSNAAAIFEKV